MEDVNLGLGHLSFFGAKNRSFPSQGPGPAGRKVWERYDFWAQLQKGNVLLLNFSVLVLNFCCID